MQYKTKSAIIISKARWCNEREKHSKYFMNLENRHFRRKTITQSKVSISSFVTNDSDILKECSSLYSMLYTSKNTAATSFSGSLFFRQEYLQLNEINKQKCEGLMTEKECL